MAMVNLARQYLEDHGETRDDYDGNCGELANVLQKVTPRSHIVSVSDIAVFDNTAWTYHTVVMQDGIIHDAWRKRAMPLMEWLEKFECEWPIKLHIDGKLFYSGKAWDITMSKRLQRKLDAINNPDSQYTGIIRTLPYYGAGRLCLKTRLPTRLFRQTG